MMEALHENEGLLLILLFALALICALAAVLSLVSFAGNRRERARLRSEKARTGESLERLGSAVQESMQRMAALSGNLNARMDALTRTNAEQLGQMQSAVGEKLDGRLGASFRVLNAQLADVHRGIGEMRDIAASVSDLKKVLSNVKTRGIWGETLLRGLLSEMFSPEQYVENAAIPLGSSSRVEFALKIPCTGGDALLLPIDSKFPQEDYLRLVDAESAGDSAQAEACMRKLERALLEQAKTISEKYIRPPQTTDFAIMFLPVEGLYLRAAQCPGLIERIQAKHRVLLAGPSTLCALLTSLQMGFRSSELEARSGEVLKLFDEMREEFRRFCEAIAKTRARIEQAESELNAMEERARKLSRKLM